MSYMHKQGKNTAWRTSLLRNLLTELIIHEKLELNLTRAQWLQPEFEKLVTLAKQNTLHARRQALAIIRNRAITPQQNVLQKLFDTLAVKYQQRPGGYTQIIKTGHRKGDNAMLAVIQLVA